MPQRSMPTLRMCLLISVLAATGCASGTVAGGRPAPFPGAPAPDWAPGVRPLDSAALMPAILDSALAFQGRPYRYGGSDPRNGFDCSGLIWYVFLMHGVQLPRTTAEQYAVGHPVDPEDIAAGDLVFFSTTAPGPSHVGLALDRNTLIHAPSTGSVVRIEPIDTPYWQSRLEGVRRLDLRFDPGSQAHAAQNDLLARP